MDILKLRYFMSVAEHLSFTAAADSLFMTQPSLSRQIADLERELGVRLFHRGKKGIQLTEEGKELYCDAVELVSKTADLFYRANMLSKGAYGRLYLGYQGMYIYSGLLEIIKEMHSTYPNVEIVLDKYHPTNLITLVRDKTIDVAWVVKMGIENVPGIDTMTVAQDRFMLVVPNTHRLAEKELISLDEVADENFVLCPRDDFSAMNDRIIRLCNDKQFSPKVVASPKHTKSVLMMVAAGIGITLLPQAYQQMFIPGVSYIAIDSNQTTIDVVVAWHKDNPKPSIQLFQQIVREKHSLTLND